MNAPLIGAHPGASALSRQYPVERFAFAADAVAERAEEAALIAFAGPADIAEARRLVNAASTRAEIAQGMSIREAAALIEPMPSAVRKCLGTDAYRGGVGRSDCLAVFGPTDPRRWGSCRVGQPRCGAERAG